MCKRYVVLSVGVLVGGLSLGAMQEVPAKVSLGQELVLREKYPFMTQDKVAWLRKTILNEPEKLSRMYSEVFGQKDFYSGYAQSELEGFAKKNPLFFVHECSREDCILSRSVLPVAREEYENVCVDNLARRKEFVDVGSGGFLTTLRILCKYFEKNPTAKITCHSIDPAYQDMIDKVMSRDAVIGLKGLVLETDDFIRKTLKQEQWQYSSWTEFFKQILSFIAGAYPKVTFRLFIYGSTISFMKSAHSEMPSLVLGCDFDEILWAEAPVLPGLLSYEQLVYDMAERSRRGIKSILLLKPLMKKTRYDVLNVAQPTLLVRTLKKQGSVVKETVNKKIAFDLPRDEE